MSTTQQPTDADLMPRQIREEMIRQYQNAPYARGENR
jgi:hypothetical protein